MHVPRLVFSPGEESFLERPEITSVFFDQIRKTGKSVLIADYEGTLTSCSIKGSGYTPYGGISQKLERLSSLGCRIVLLSKGKVCKVCEKFDNSLPLEIWGLYGAEKRDPQGKVTYNGPDPSQEEGLVKAFELAREILEEENLELNPLSVKAFFHKSSPGNTVDLLRELENSWIHLVPLHGLRLLTYEGHMEILARGFDKGSALREILSNTGMDIPCCYLGKDITDEEPFNFLWGRGLTALVNKDHHETSAHIWLQPPEDLFKFLDDWIWNLENWEIDSRD